MPRSGLTLPRMQADLTHAPYLISLAARLCARVTVRDNLHLSPDLLSRSVARRLRQGLRHLEAFVRRLLILLALALEPGLQPTLRVAPMVRRDAKKKPKTSNRFRVYPLDLASPDWPDLSAALRTRGEGPGGPVPAAPLLARLSALRALIDAPQARARRLAYMLARKRPGLLLAPDLGREAVPPRLGTEIFSIYRAMGREITVRSRARPPPLPPVPRRPPRVRLL